MTSVAEACSDLAQWLPRAAALIPQPDIRPAAGRTAPHSRPPWNSEAAGTVHEIIGTLADLRQEFGHAIHGRYNDRDPAYRHAGRTLRAIERLAAGAGARAEREAALIVDACVTRIMQLPAIDLEPAWRRIPAPCPRCGRPMLRACVRDGRVACLGCQARGQMMPGTVSDGYIRWDDGTLT